MFYHGSKIVGVNSPHLIYWPCKWDSIHSHCVHLHSGLHINANFISIYPQAIFNKICKIQWESFMREWGKQSILTKWVKCKAKSPKPNSDNAKVNSHQHLREPGRNSKARSCQFIGVSINAPTNSLATFLPAKGSRSFPLFVERKQGACTM